MNEPMNEPRVALGAPESCTQSWVNQSQLKCVVSAVRRPLRPLRLSVRRSVSALRATAILGNSFATYTERWAGAAERQRRAHGQRRPERVLAVAPHATGESAQRAVGWRPLPFFAHAHCVLTRAHTLDILLTCLCLPPLFS